MDHHASLGPAVPEGTHPTAPSAPVRVEPPPNQLGHYRLNERVGVGGQAAVYRARRLDDPDGRDVALKRLHPHLIDDPGSVQGFSREARIAYLLDHPVIRRVLALHRQPAELFMVMEYVDGLSVTDLLRRAAASERCLPLAGVLTVLDRVCDALAYAHELVDERGASAGLVHRDVSPSNVLVTSAGRVKLIDLGVARSESAEHATSSGLIKGKYGYMAPEVMQGAPFDRRADVFSVGVLAWELVTVRKLFPVNQHAFDLDRVRARPIAPPIASRKLVSLTMPMVLPLASTITKWRMLYFSTSCRALIRSRSGGAVINGAAMIASTSVSAGRRSCRARRMLTSVMMPNEVSVLPTSRLEMCSCAIKWAAAWKVLPGAMYRTARVMMSASVVVCSAVMVNFSARRRAVAVVN